MFNEQNEIRGREDGGGEKGDAIGKRKEHLSREGRGSEAVNQDGRRPSSLVQPFALHGLRRVEDSKAVESRASEARPFYAVIQLHPGSVVFK